MTEQEFRAGFNTYRRSNELAFVADENDFGIAVGLDGPETIVLHDGRRMAMANARFIGQQPEDL